MLSKYTTSGYGHNYYYIIILIEYEQLLVMRCLLTEVFCPDESLPPIEEQGRSAQGGPLGKCRSGTVAAAVSVAVSRAIDPSCRWSIFTVVCR